MAQYVDTVIYDAALLHLAARTTHLHLLDALPSVYSDIAGHTLGFRPLPVFGSPAAASPTGRKIVMTAFADGNITVTGTATHWALVDASNQDLLVAQTISASTAVTAGGVFGFSAITITVP